MSSKAERLKYNLRHYDEMCTKLMSLENLKNDILSETELLSILQHITSELTIIHKHKKLVSIPYEKRQLGKNIGELEQQKRAVLDYMKRNNI